jgi:FAD:protein FMN transferase
VPARPAEAGPGAVPLPAVPQAWRAIGLDRAGTTAAVLVPFGVALDLGATGKAFAADLVAATLAAELGVDCIVSLGGDVAIGDADPGDDPVRWRVGVGEAPDGEPDELVELDRGGVATSSTVHRRWTRGGRDLHHLLDPRTGAPVDPVWRTVSTTGATCVAANTASTMAMVLGALAPQWLAERDIPGRLVDVHGSVSRVCGWPEPDPDAAPGRGG